MSRRQKNPLRPLTDEERAVLEQVCRAQQEPASHVARARALLHVADGGSYEAAAKLAGRCCGDVVAQWIARFNVEGVAALQPGHGGGRRSCMVPRNESGFWPKCDEHLTESKMAPRHGR